MLVRKTRVNATGMELRMVLCYAGIASKYGRSCFRLCSVDLSKMADASFSMRSVEKKSNIEIDAKQKPYSGNGSEFYLHMLRSGCWKDSKKGRRVLWSR